MSEKEIREAITDAKMNENRWRNLKISSRQTLISLAEDVLNAECPEEKIGLIDDDRFNEGYVVGYNLAVRNCRLYMAKMKVMEEQKYPCADCGKLRTKAQGGTTFTVCDECWDKHYKKQKEGYATEKEIWCKIREIACNGTTDCENSPECITDDGCLPDDIAKALAGKIRKPLTRERLVEIIIESSLCHTSFAERGECEKEVRELAEEILKETGQEI